MAAGMIGEGRMQGSIDQIEGYVYFNSECPSSCNLMARIAASPQGMEQHLIIAGLQGGNLCNLPRLLMVLVNNQHHRKCISFRDWQCYSCELQPKIGRAFSKL